MVGVVAFGQGSRSTLGGEEEDECLGLRFINVQGNLAVGVLGEWASEISEVGKGLGIVKVGKVSVPSFLGFLLFPVVRDFLGGERESEDIFHVVFGGGGGVKGADDGHLTSLGADGGVKFIGDDGDVWLPVEGDQFDLSGGTSSVNVSSWGNGDNDWFVGSLADGDPEGELGNKVALDTAFNLALDVWDLEGDLGVAFVSGDSVNLGLELGVRTTSVKFSLSTEGDHARETELEAHGETQDGGEIHGLVGELDGLLVVE